MAADGEGADEMAADGAGLPCPGNSVVAEEDRGKKDFKSDVPSE
jgi:hypothetical protein